MWLDPCRWEASRTWSIKVGVGVVMMGLPGDVYRENDPDRSKVGGICNGSRRVLRELREGLSSDMKGDDGIVVVVKRE